MSENKQAIAELIALAASDQNHVAVEAIRELRDRGALSDGSLQDVDLSGANLSGADLHDADLRRADLRRANLSRADLSGADLRGADLRGADLRRADLRRADLREADLRGAALDGARLSGARLRGANVTDEQLRQARTGKRPQEEPPRAARTWKRSPEASLPPTRDDTLTSRSGGHGAPPPFWPRWQAPAPQRTVRRTTISAPVLRELLSKISVAHPKLLSKRFASRFVIHVYWKDDLEEVKRELRQMFGEDEFARVVEDTHLRLGSVVEMALQSPEIAFSDPVVRQLEEPVTRFLFLGKPEDSCRPGKEHTVLLSVRHAETGRELESIVFDVQVVDYAFDHVSHPLLSKVAAGLSGLGAVVIFILTVLQHVNTTVGLASGAAIAIFAGAIYARFVDLFCRLDSTTNSP